MQLSDWLKKTGIQRSEFAARIGVKPQTITGWCDGTFWITRRRAQAVFDETKGKVTPNDFFMTRKQRRQ